MLKRDRDRGVTEAQRLMLLVTVSWLLPVLLLAACVMLAGCGGGR